LNYIAPKIAFIGKPNNGKSSIISTLTMDDRIKIAPEAGTTTQVNEYKYIDKNNRVIAIFYDTPGFEHPRKVFELLKSYSINDTITQLNDKKYKKDVEILKAIRDSDILSFVIDSSLKPDINTHGYEIGIINLVNKKSIVVLNPHLSKNYNKEWREFLKEYKLVKVVEFNPLKSGFSQINSFFDAIEKFYPEIKELKKWHKEDFENRLNRSFELIADGIYELVTFEYTTKANKPIGKLKEEFFKKLNAIEQNLKNEIKKLWGYYDTKVEDTKFSLEDEQFSKEIGFSKAKIIALGVLVGALLAVVDGGITLFSTLSAALVGGIVAASVSVVSDKLNNKVTFKLDNKKGFFVMLSSILRNMEFLKALLSHGHANRSGIKISDDIQNWSFKVDSFNKDEQKKLAKIFASFISHKNVIENKKELKELLLHKFLQINKL